MKEYLIRDRADSSLYLDDAEHSLFRAKSGETNWITSHQHDIVCVVCQLNTKANRTTIDYVTQANKILCKIKQKVVILKYQKLRNY